MRKLLRNMCTMLMASVLLVTGSCGGTTWVSGVENTNTLIEKLTNIEEIKDPEKYTQIYSREDAEKNKGFIRMLKEDFDQYNVELKLVILEEIDKPEVFVKNANIDFAINRSRNSYIAELLEKREIRVFNNSMVTDIANNKGKN